MPDKRGRTTADAARMPGFTIHCLINSPIFEGTSVAQATSFRSLPAVTGTRTEDERVVPVPDRRGSAGAGQVRQHRLPVLAGVGPVAEGNRQRHGAGGRRGRPGVAAILQWICSLTLRKRRFFYAAPRVCRPQPYVPTASSRSDSGAGRECADCVSQSESGVGRVPRPVNPHASTAEGFWYNANRIKITRMNFKVVIQQDEDGRFNASCPELEGCFLFGNTVEEAKKNITEAIELYLQDIPEEEISSIRIKVEIAEVTI